MNQIRLTTVILSLVVTLFILFCGYLLYDKYYIKNGLEEKINQIVNVEEINIAKKENPPTVYIRSSDIKNLQTAHQKTAEVVYQTLGPEFRVVFLDERSEKLSNLYEKCSFVIQEGIATGKFQDMNNKVQKLAAAEDVQCHLTIDSSNIYMELDDDNGYLYEVIPRLNHLGEQEKPGSESN
ncbi:MAG: hypothetical protein WBI44_08695 [Syntrophaceticus sp.]